MYKVKRTIYLGKDSVDIWIGLVSKTKNGKNGKYTVYLLTDDPDKPCRTDSQRYSIQRYSYP